MDPIVAQHAGGQRIDVVIGANRIVLDQPRESGGTGFGPTPTELFVASLAACVAHYAQRFLDRNGLTRGVRVAAEYDMSDERPSRVRAVRLSIAAGDELPEPVRTALVRVAERCTVHNSIRIAPAVDIIVARAARAA